MNKPNLSKIVHSIRTTLTKHSPEILTGIGIVGMATGTIMAVKATPKALILIEERKNEENVDSLSGLEVVKTCWKCYIPTVATEIVSIACLIGASRVSLKRNAALATAYTLSETALKEYQEKVIETIGEKKEQAVRDKVAQDKIENNPVGKNEVIITKKGDTLFYEMTSKRYFRSDIEKIRKAENVLNKRLMNEMQISLNEVYYELGLSGTDLGELMEWDIDKGFIEFSFSACLSEDEEPCIAVGHNNPPTYSKYR